MAGSDSERASSGDDVVLINPDDVSNYNEENILPQPPETIARIRAWLTPTDYSSDDSEYQKHRASHLAGTCIWLPSLDQFQQWRNGEDNGLLWIKGIPGSGKSVYAATLAEEFFREGVPVLYFFFRQIIDANHQPVNLLRDWLDQILLFSPPLQKTLKSLIEDGRSLDSVAIDDFWDYLGTALAQLPRVYCVADALDEMDQENATFIQHLAALGHWRPAHVKVLMTSRPVVAVETPLRHTDYIEVRLEEKMVDVDIATYVRCSLEGSEISDADRELVKEAVPGRANGLFLYAKLAMAAFLRPNADIQSVLADLPLDLNEMYTNILHEHVRRSGISAEIQLLILKWVTHAVRPLRLLELADMIKTTESQAGKLSLKDAKGLVRTACGPLLEILPDETVSVVHHSLTEFLVGATRQDKSTSFPVLDPGSTHYQLAVTCLTYMTSGSAENDEVERLSSRSPFAYYVLDNWDLHATRADWEGNDNTRLYDCIEMFMNDVKVRNTWILDSWRDPERHEWDLTRISSLHIAAYCGFSKYISMLLTRDGIDQVDQRDPIGRTPLSLAAGRGHWHTVEVLIRAGANPKSEDDDAQAPIHEAAKHNHSEVVRLLLKAGADPLSSGPSATRYTPAWEGSPLFHACVNGHLEALEAMMPFLQPIHKQHALYWAAEYRRPRLVRQILQAPDVDPNHKIGAQTPLLIASMFGDLESIETLIEHGAKPDIECPLGSNPHLKTLPCTRVALMELAGRDRYEVSMDPDEFERALSLMIRAGADIDWRDSYGRTALHTATSLAVVKLLLKAGADPHATTDEGQTVLHLCPAIKDVDCLRLVVEEAGVDINKKNRVHGQTPLQSAISWCPKLALNILDFKPDLDIADNDGNTALHHALASAPRFNGLEECEDVLYQLLNAGANPDIRNSRGETPLHILASCPEMAWNDDLLRTLLDRGADINAKDGQARTPLFRIIEDINRCMVGPVSIIDRFVSLGASLDVRDAKGRSLLHECLRLGTNKSLLVYRHLVGLGLSPFMVDHDGNTLVHEIANKERSLWSTTDLLSDVRAAGLDISKPNNTGMTALHFLAQKSCRDNRDTIHALEWLSKHSTVINDADSRGLRPIHLATSVSSCTVECFLEARANPFVQAFDGTNVLHIATKCQKIDTLGNLLRRMKDTDPTATALAVNAKDESEMSPLHYACRSGSLEAVSLLLEAGADPNLPYNIFRNEKPPSQVFTPFRPIGVVADGLRARRSRLSRIPREAKMFPPILQCARAEEELFLWDASKPSKTGLLAAGLTARDDTRPCPRDSITSSFHGCDSPFHETCSDSSQVSRYEEITTLLLSAGAKPSLDTSGASIIDAVEYTAENRDDRNVKNLWDLQERIGGNQILTSLSVKAQMSLARRQSDMKVLREVTLAKPGDVTWNVVSDVLKEGQFSLVTDLYHAGVDFLEARGHQVPILQGLASEGFAKLLDQCCTPEDVARFDDIEWCAQRYEQLKRHVPGYCGTWYQPLLHTACRRLLPNMDVVKILVEKKKAHVNARFSPDLSGTYGDATALHYLAEGKAWWHIALALPYLVSEGADLHARDRNGQPPLRNALTARNLRTGPYALDAIRKLIDLGADINDVDKAGKSCLAIAGQDPAVIKLLIDHGASVSPEAIETVAVSLDIEALHALLSNPKTSNLDELWNPKSKPPKNLTPSTRPRGCIPGDVLVRVSQIRREDAGIRSAKMMRALLEVGASPYSRYSDYKWRNGLSYDPYHAMEPQNRASRTFWQEDKNGYAATQEPGELSNPDDKRVRVKLTVFHEILRNGWCYKPIFDLDHLDLEHRDACGRTPFMAACFCYNNANAVEAIDLLLKRGANPLAVDNLGRNVLHLLLGGGSKLKAWLAALKLLEDAFPALINQPDKFGYYPLHYGLANYLNVVFEFGEASRPIGDVLANKWTDPTVLDGDGNSALHYLSPGLANLPRALHANTQPLFRKFVELGLDVNHRNHAGQTPIHFLRPTDVAEASYITKAAEFMDEMGADWKARDNRGQTVLHQMATLDRQTFREAMARGVDELLEDVDGRTSLDVAAAAENEEVLGLFRKTAPRKRHETVQTLSEQVLGRPQLYD